MMVSYVPVIYVFSPHPQDRWLTADSWPYHHLVLVDIRSPNEYEYEYGGCGVIGAPLLSISGCGVSNTSDQWCSNVVIVSISG